MTSAPVPACALETSTPIVLLSLVGGLAAGLRLLGLDYGLPAVYNPDEVAIMSRTLAFGTGDLNPHNFLYPTLYFYLLFGWLGLLFVVGWATGSIESLAAFQTSFFVDPSDIYLAGRLLTAVLGTLTVVATYSLGRRLCDRATGLTAALFLAAAPLHVRDSHYVKHDIVATLAIVLAYIAAVRLWRGEDARTARRDVLLAGACCGVAFSIHYYAIFLVLPVAAAIWRRFGRHGVAHAARESIYAGVAAALVFFAGSPFILVEPVTAWRDIVANREIVIDRAVQGSAGAFGNAAEYLSWLSRDALGWPVFALSVAGTIFMARRAPRSALLLWLFPAAFLLFIANTVTASRYLNPILPMIAIAAAYGLTHLAALARSPAGRVSERGHGPGSARRQTIALAAGALLVATPPLMESVRAGLFFGRADTRTLALEFVEREVPDGASVLIQPYSVPIEQSTESLREALVHHLGSLDAASTKFQLRLAIDPARPAYRTIYLGDGGLDVDKIYVGYSELGGSSALTRLRQLGVRYAIVKRYNHPAPPTLPFLDAIEREGRLLARFSPYRAAIPPDRAAAIEPFLHNTDTRLHPALERPGPIVEVWQLS